jgi:hypothetical protein
MNIPEPDVDMTLTMPWPLICRLACQARVRGISLGQLVGEALAEHLARSAA